MSVSLDDCCVGSDYHEVWGEDPPQEIAALAFVSGSELQDLAAAPGTVSRDRAHRRLVNVGGGPGRGRGGG